MATPPSQPAPPAPLPPRTAPRPAQPGMQRPPAPTATRATAPAAVPPTRAVPSRPAEPPADWVPKGQATAEPKPNAAKAWGFALGAALVGAVLWGIIRWKFDVEVGYIAWAIGLMAGGGALASNGMRHHRILVAPAIVASLLGIVIGKFLGVYFVVFDFLGFAEALDFYVDLIELDYGLLDALFVALAVYTAWRLTRPRKTPGQTL